MIRTEITEGDYDTVDQSKARGEPLKQPPHARASRPEDHAAPNPRSRGRAAEKKDMPEPQREAEDEPNPRNAIAVSDEEQQVCDPIQACDT